MNRMFYQFITINLIYDGAVFEREIHVLQVFNMIIFVYGTLLKGLERCYILDRSEFIGAAVAGSVQLYDLGAYPGIKCGDGAVIGELYDVDDITLETLDMIEGFDSNNINNSLYLRSEIRIIAPSITIPVYSYFYNLPVDESSLIEDGDYRKFLLSGTVR